MSDKFLAVGEEIPSVGEEQKPRLNPHWGSEMLKVMYIGPFLLPTGYGEATRSGARALKNAGAGVMAQLNSPLAAGLVNEYIKTEHDINEMLDPRFWPADAREREPEVFLWHVTPDAMGRVGDRPNLLYAVWETQGLPDGWVDACNRTDGLLTCSEFSARLFREAGVTKPIAIAPHPIDIDRFSTVENPQPRIPGIETMFLVVSQWMPRKGIEDILIAFGSEFEPDEPVGMTLLIWRWGHGFKERMACKGYAREILSRLNKPTARVWLLGERLDPLALPSVYQATSVIVSASRGEAFGLPIFEAAACGVPSISTGWGGQWDYLTDESAYRVAYDMETVHNAGGNWKHYTARQKWARPRLDDLRRAMREAHEDPAGRQARGEKAHQIVVEQFAVAEAGRTMLGAIRGLLDQKA